MPTSGIKIVHSQDLAVLYEPRVRQQLQQWGMSSLGIQQIARGQMPTDARDREIVASIVAQAARA